MAVAWPGTLQDLLNQSNFSINLGETVVRSEMDTGPRKFRRRFTKGVDSFSCAIWATTSQYNTFIAFFDTSLNGGVETFDFDHPITGVSTEFKFSSPPQITYIGGDTFNINMVWETVP